VWKAVVLEVVVVKSQNGSKNTAELIVEFPHSQTEMKLDRFAFFKVHGQLEMIIPRLASWI
jgi:hypothetical protein